MLVMMGSSLATPGRLLVAAVICLLLAPPARSAGNPAGGQFPTSAEEAIALDENEVGEWVDGPMSLFILEDEKEIWESLTTDEQRRRFIGWFWARRDDDLRDNLHPTKMEIYGRVAEANRRFTNIPRGWRTDRGRVWVMLGRPERIRSDFEDRNMTWNYFAPGLQTQLAFDNQAGELDVFFARQPPHSYRISGGIAPGAWPAYVVRIMAFVRRSIVTQPGLEWRGDAS